MDLPVIKVTNPYGIPEDILNNARAQREDNPFDIRKDGVAGFLMKALGLLGTATGNRAGMLKPAPKLPQVDHVPQGVLPQDLFGTKNWKEMAPVRPGQGTEVPANKNNPQYQGPVQQFPPDLDPLISKLNSRVNDINTNLFREFGNTGAMTSTEGLNFAPKKLIQDELTKPLPKSNEMGFLPGMRPAGEPLGSPQPKSMAVEYLFGPNEGKGNFGTTDWMNMKQVANDSDLKGLKGLTQAEKYEITLQDQQLKKLGHDPDMMSAMERLKVLFPALFQD